MKNSFLGHCENMCSPNVIVYTMKDIPGLRGHTRYVEAGDHANTELVMRTRLDTFTTKH